MIFGPGRHRLCSLELHLRMGPCAEDLARYPFVGACDVPDDRPQLEGEFGEEGECIFPHRGIPSA